jgi:hypothetical protein
MEVKMNISIMDLLPKSVAMGTAMMLSQREKGMEKYGQPIEDANLSALELVEHAAQEAADGLVYISELPAKVKALHERIYKLECELVEANNTVLAAQGHLRDARYAYWHGCIYGNMTELRDVLTVSTENLPPSKHEQALRKIQLEFDAPVYLNVNAVRDIVREALK